MSLGTDSILRNERVDSGPTDCSAPGNSRLPSAPGPLHRSLRGSRSPSGSEATFSWEPCLTPPGLGRCPQRPREQPPGPRHPLVSRAGPDPLGGKRKGGGRLEGRGSDCGAVLRKSQQSRWEPLSAVSASYSPSRRPGPAREQPWRLGLGAKGTAVPSVTSERHIPMATARALPFFFWPWQLKKTALLRYNNARTM